jgi:hypothetical protein
VLNAICRSVATVKVAAKRQGSLLRSPVCRLTCGHRGCPPEYCVPQTRSEGYEHGERDFSSAGRRHSTAHQPVGIPGYCCTSAANPHRRGSAGRRCPRARCPGPIPSTGEIRTLLGLSTSSIYRGIAAGKIPRPISLDGLLVPDQPCGPEAPRRRVRAPAATKGRPPNPRRTARDTTPQTA